MKLNKLSKVVTKKLKRRGRGYGSGKGGHTVGYGQKGQKSRSGYKKLRSWIRESKVQSLPKLRGIGKRSAKRGFFKSKIDRNILNISDLNKYSSGSTIDKKFLRDQKIIKSLRKNIEVKILGKGELKKKITVKGLKVSEIARKKIEKAGGKVN